MTLSKTAQIPLADGEVRLILMNLTLFSDFRTEAGNLLSSDERERAERYKIAEVAERFVLARGLLRRHLGAFLNADPSSLRFQYGEQGKPFLPDAPLSFNLSHSGDWAVLAVAKGRELGVDIEKIRVLENDRLPERYFSAPEAIVYRVTPDDHREEAFFHFWTAKESFLKARGDGLSRGLKDYSFSDPWDMPPRLTWVAWDENEPKRWHFHRFSPSNGYLGTLAYSGDVAEVKEFKDL